MPRCPAEADKAIRLAWERERELVRKGRGTRDWTPEQQQDILEYGKAFDDDGKAFEGQHMKSAAQYPKYQGNPDNIQFLTRKEHLEAHNGSWLNPSNWYYDPIQKQFFDFGDGDPIPCAVIEMSNPIIRIDNHDISAEAPEVKQIDKKPTSGTDPPVQHSDQLHPANTSIQDAVTNQETKPTPKGTRFNNIIAGVKKAGKYIWNNYRGEIIAGCIAMVTSIVDSVTSSTSNSKSDVNSSHTSDTPTSLPTSGHDSRPVIEDDCSHSSNITDDTVQDELSEGKRKSPIPHNVNARGQHYWINGERVWKEKEDYRRGDKNHTE